jgi:glycosyltransferase involved in cell wall biosynthesis
MSRETTSLLYVSDSPTVSGAEIVFLHYLEKFTAPRYRTHVFLAERNERLIREVEKRGISYTATNAFSRTPIRTTLNPRDLADFGRAMVQTSKALARVIRERNVDIVHTTMYPATLYVALASRMTGVKQIWHEHNIKKIHAVNRPIYRWVSQSCWSLLGPSDAVTARLEDTGIDPQKIRTLYNGINLASFNRARVDQTRVRAELGLTEGQRAVGLFGQMLSHKGHHTLIEAAPAILQRFPNTTFFFVGALENAPYQDELKATLRARGLESRFVFTGWRQNVPELITAMDVNVVPTLTPEPAALSLMETMAMEGVVVASRTGGTAELIVDGETGLLFERGDSATLATLVNSVLGDDALAARLGRAGRQRMEDRFTLERHLADVERLYQHCLASESTKPVRRAALTSPQS